MATPEPGTLVQLAVLLLTLEPHRDALPLLPAGAESPNRSRDIRWQRRALCLGVPLAVSKYNKVTSIPARV